LYSPCGDGVTGFAIEFSELGDSFLMFVRKVAPAIKEIVLRYSFVNVAKIPFTSSLKAFEIDCCGLGAPDVMKLCDMMPAGVEYITIKEPFLILNQHELIMIIQRLGSCCEFLYLKFALQFSIFIVHTLQMCSMNEFQQKPQLKKIVLEFFATDGFTRAYEITKNGCVELQV